MRIDLNSDLGEGFGPWQMGDDAAMLGIVSTANIACGFHAGDPAVMRATIAQARAQGVEVGAHPGYADLQGFGRRPMAGITDREVENLVAYQVGAFAAMAALAGHAPRHVKTHGALANACADDAALARAVARGVRAADPALALMVMPGTPTEAATEAEGLRPIREIYADRAYADSFNLAPRRQPGTVFHDVDQVVARALAMVGEGRITSVSGKVLAVGIDSICIHGDNPAAVAMARALRAGLEAAGYAIRSAVAGD